MVSVESFSSAKSNRLEMEIVEGKNFGSQTSSQSEWDNFNKDEYLKNQKNPQHDFLKRGGGVKGHLNNVKNTDILVHMGFPNLTFRCLDSVYHYIFGPLCYT